MAGPVAGMVAVALVLCAGVSSCAPSGDAGERTVSGHNSNGEPASERKGRLVITGSSTMAPLVSEIAQRFEQQYPGLRVDVQTGGSGRGILDVRAGMADVGMVSRHLRDDEVDLKAIPLATDGICLIAHRDNPIEELDREQVIGLFTGQIRNWREVGGEFSNPFHGSVVIVNKAEGRSTLELFLAHYQLRSRDIRASVVIGDNEQGIKTVAGNRHAIGYVSIGTAQWHVQHGTSIKMLAIDGVDPTRERLQDGSFPLIRTLNLVIGDTADSAPEELVGQFLTFARSRDVHDLIRQHEFVPAND